ncbi:MAG: IS630 transposase-related protein [Synechococcales bacterium]|nr:IS630 transposase-related protein [Synechococcales bacterium]
MARPYSPDFRRKVIEAIEVDGMKKQTASRVFQVSRNTIDLWLKLKAETGDVNPKARKPAIGRSKITDWDKFRAFAAAHENTTQAEMAQLWGGDVNQRIISRALHKIGHVRRKR